MNTKVVTKRVRIAYPQLFTPRGFQGGPEKYSVTVLVPKSNTELVQEIRRAMDAAATDRWGPKAAKMSVKHWFRDGDEEGKGPDFEGHFFFACKSDSRPQVVDRSKASVSDPDTVRSGDWARVSFNCYAYDTQGSKGVSFGLGNVMWLARGEAIGGGARAEQDFGDDWEDDTEEATAGTSESDW